MSENSVAEITSWPFHSIDPTHPLAGLGGIKDTAFHSQLP